jgi:HAD superfamily phosphoserine phosphatase-like hydrolase
MKKVAFFDIDGTLFRSSLLIKLVDALIEAEIFPRDARAHYVTEYHAWLHREGTYETYIDAVVASFMEHIRGVHYGDFIEVGRSMVVRELGKVYTYPRTLLRELTQEGYYLVAISQSPKAILDEFCAAYGFDKVYGRIYEIGPRDCFTGVVTDLEFIRDKAAVVARAFEQLDVTSQDSIGIGDTEGDIGLLESVAQPICFNPNRALYEIAKERGWKVVVERKDVIYTL